jgi:hypothetical protein
VDALVSFIRGFVVVGVIASGALAVMEGWWRPGWVDGIVAAAVVTLLLRMLLRAR